MKMEPIIIDSRTLGTEYTMQPGDVLSVHSHGEIDIHYTLLAVGKIKLLLPNHTSHGRIVEGPYKLNWRVGIQHGIEAMTFAIFWNILKNPAG